MKHETTCAKLTCRPGPLPRAAAVCLLLAPLLFAGALAAPDAEEPLPAGADLMDRHIEATGGREAYDRIENRVTTATLDFVGQGLSLDMTIHVARPNKNYTVIESEMIGKAEKGTDGETAWELSMMTGPQIMKGQQKADFLRDAALDKLAHWQEHYSAVETVGVETVGEATCYKVILTSDGGPPLTMLLDRESYLPVKFAMDLETPMGVVPMETFPGDFREVDGLLLAHSGRIRLAGQERAMTIKSVEHNAELPADLFDLPEEIQALVNKAAAGE